MSCFSCVVWLQLSCYRLPGTAKHKLQTGQFLVLHVCIGKPPVLCLGVSEGIS